MPRDINGVYTLPAPMPVQPRTIPVTNVFNTVLADVKDALNNIPGDALAPGSVGTTQLEDNSVTNAKMANNSVDTAELVDNSVTNAKMANNSVDTAELVDGAVTETKLGGLLATSGTNSLRIGINNTGGTGVELGGQAGVAATALIDFHSGAVATDFDSRIQATGGNGVDGGGTLTISANDLLLGQGRLRFPATQNPSTDPNTLDDYEEGTFTPAITFSTPGNLSVTYSTQAGKYTKTGDLVTFSLRVQTATFTHTTAAGAARITGLPFVVQSGNPHFPCCIGYAVGMSALSNEQLMALAVPTASYIDLYRSNGVASFTASPTTVPTGGTKDLIISGSYKV